MGPLYNVKDGTSVPTRRGGRGGRGPSGGGRGPGGGGPLLSRGTLGIAVVAGLILWGMASFYTVKPEEQSVELLLGEYSSTGNPGLNFAVPIP